VAKLGGAGSTDGIINILFANIVSGMGETCCKDTNGTIGRL
jgi:hypothetical protein